jgi:hypothetical protein
VKKDIVIPKVEGIGLAIAKELDEGEEIYKAYFINFNNFPVENILISSKGYGMKDEKHIKTTTFRHYFTKVEAQSFQLIELITEEVFGINNEFFVTYYIDKLIYDKKYVF